MERDKYLSSLLYSTCEGLRVILSFPPTPRTKYIYGKKKTISITNFRKLPFANDFRIETEGGYVLSALSK